MVHECYNNIARSLTLRNTGVYFLDKSGKCRGELGIVPRTKRHKDRHFIHMNCDYIHTTTRNESFS